MVPLDRKVQELSSKVLFIIVFYLNPYILLCILYSIECRIENNFEQLANLMITSKLSIISYMKNLILIMKFLKNHERLYMQYNLHDY